MSHADGNSTKPETGEARASVCGVRPMSAGVEHQPGAGDPLSRVCLSGMRKEAERMKQQTTIRLPDELKEQLQREAVLKGISFNAYVLLLIDRGRRSEQE